MVPNDTDETFDSIPWERLLSDPGDRRRRLLTYAIVGLAALGVSASLSRTLWPVSTPESPPVESSAPATPATSTPTFRETAIAEADLLAVDDQPAVIGGVAELFLTEFFTVEPGTAAASAMRSFVDSAHVVGVSSVGLGEYRVTAVVRVLYQDASGFRRLDPMWVEVPIRLEADGYVATSAPRLVTPRPVFAEPEGTVQVPEDVKTVAGEMAAVWGDPVEVADEGLVDDDGWTVTVVVQMADGVSWPFALSVPAQDAEK